MLYVCEYTWLVVLMSEVEEVVIVASQASDSSSSNTGTRTSKGVKEATLYHWKYSHYFKVVEEGDKT